MNKFYFTLLLACFFNTIKAQPFISDRMYPQADFRPPLDITPATLAGSFGEIRGNHFHSGLDLRTNQREGYPVYAAADGYIVRLRVQIAGGGNIVYINHPNGYTTVYMHLQRFNDRIAQAIKSYQYKQKQYDVDFFLLPIEIQVKKGEIIAWSGKTGAVAGPHLHFEIRNSKTEETINPQLFGLDVPDQSRPAINGMYVYRTNGLPFSDKTPKQYYQVVGSGGNYHLNQSPVLNISGEVGFGIMTNDLTSTGNKNGIYSIELQMDGQIIYFSAVEGFYFNNSRAVNSHIDYPALLTTGRTIQKSFVEPGNPLNIYKALVNRGLVNITDEEIHNLQYTIKDSKGNTSTLAFKIKFNSKAVIPTSPAPGVKAFSYDKDNEFSTEDVKVNIPKGNLYSDISLIYSKTAKPAGGFSAVHHIHNRLTPLHQNFTLSILPDSTLSPALYSKAVIVNSNGTYQGGEFDNGFVKSAIRTFGNYYVKVDTLAPVITPITISAGRSMAGMSKISVKISDNLSGFKSYSGTVDGEWILMAFDYKTSTLAYTFDERVNPGKHVFQLVVTDMKLNTKTYTSTFYR